VNRDVIGEAETFDRADRCVLDMDSDDWDELLVPEIERQHANGRRVAVRADAAFAKPEIYEALETRGVDFVRRDGRALDQGRQTGGPLDAAVLSPVPRERGPAERILAFIATAPNQDQPDRSSELSSAFETTLPRTQNIEHQNRAPGTRTPNTNPALGTQNAELQ